MSRFCADASIAASSEPAGCESVATFNSKLAKGVHAAVTEPEACLAVIHRYLLLAPTRRRAQAAAVGEPHFSAFDQ